MRFFHSLRRRLRSLFEGDASNAALREELQFHLQRQTEENIARGMPVKEAEQAARASFGSLSEAVEACYQARGVGWLDDLRQDVRYGLRTLVKHRSFSLMTVLTLALGIGACTAIFSVVNAVLIQSLPYGHTDRLVYLFTPNRQWKLPAETFGPSPADFFDVKKESKSFAAMTFFQQTTYNLAGNDRVERVTAAQVDSDFFRTLQVVPQIGRPLDTKNEKPGDAQVAVISYRLWQTVLGGRSDVLGSTLRLDGVPFRVIGVMPRDFGYPHKSDLAYGNPYVQTTDLWVPQALTPAERLARDNYFGFALARLKPGVTVREAQAEMQAIMARLSLLHNPGQREWSGLVKSFQEIALGPVQPLMLLLMGSVGLVLLIACGNGANLLLARAVSRTHELGVRATLGARRGRLLRQMLTEALMLSTAAGVVGVGLAWLFLRLLLKFNPGDIPRMGDARLDLRVMGFVLAVTVLTSLLFGTLPSLLATRIHLSEFLKSSGTRGVVGDRRSIRAVLAVAQIGVLTVLLTATGLLLRSYVNVLLAPKGFATTTVTADLQLSPQYGDAQRRSAVFETLVDRLKAAPGVEAVGVVTSLPLSNTEGMAPIVIKGSPNEGQQLIELRGITQDYLAAMQTPLLEGRNFSDADVAGQRPVAIINEAFARKYFADRDAIGGQISPDADGPWATVIGVAKNVRYMSLETPAVPLVYRPFHQIGWFQWRTVGSYIAVRSSLPAGAVGAEIRAAVKRIDPTLAVGDLHTMGELVSEVTAGRRFQVVLLTVFSCVAVLLAMVGVYGLLAYSVKQRTGEIGIRMALGSSKGRVVGLILREGVRLLGAGLVVGAAASPLCTRLMAGFLYGVPWFDPATLALVPLILFVATIAACLIPSARAAAIDPMSALRHE